MKDFPEILRTHSVDAKRWIAARMLVRAIRLDRAFVIFWAFLTFFMFAAIAVAAFVIGRQLVTPPPFTYTSHRYTADQPLLCPGEPVMYTLGLTVHEVPTVVEIVRTVWQVEPPRTAVRDMPIGHAIWTDTGTFTNTVSTVIPPDAPLLPGAYELRVSAEDAADGEIEWHTVPFEIRGDC